MIAYILGVLTGIITMGFLFTQKTPIERTFNQVASKVQKKGAILEPEDTTLSTWLDELKNEEETM